MKRFKADLHIHTALSPCAFDEMTPPAIVEEAITKGLDMIAICDHNAAGNIAATQKAAGEYLAVVAGVEITTVEDIHVVGLLPNAEAAVAVADKVRATLPDSSDSAGKFGRQNLMDSDGEVIGAEPKMLAASSKFSLSETVALIKQHDGVAIAAHVNRPSFSVMSQLGFFPSESGFDAIEVFVPALFHGKIERGFLYGLPVVVSSDSHFLYDVGAHFTELEMNEPTYDELILAVKGLSGRGRVYA